MFPAILQNFRFFFPAQKPPQLGDTRTVAGASLSIFEFGF
jgi:hypothetical protein